MFGIQSAIYHRKLCGHPRCGTSNHYKLAVQSPVENNLWDLKTKKYATTGLVCFQTSPPHHGDAALAKVHPALAGFFQLGTAVEKRLQEFHELNVGVPYGARLRQHDEAVLLDEPNKPVPPIHEIR